MSSKQKNLLKEVPKINQNSNKNKVDLNIKLYNDHVEEEKKEESEYEEEEEEEDDDEEEKIEEENIEEKIEDKKEEENENFKSNTKRSNNEKSIDINSKGESMKDNLEKISIKDKNENNIIKNKKEENNNINEEINEKNIDKKEMKDENKEKQKVNPPTIRKFNIAKSSSTNNLDIINNNNNPIFKINFQAEEIRTNDIYENKKVIKKVNKIKICYKCGDINIDESKSINFSCNHIYCLNCIIKDLLLLQFKNLENKNNIQLNCACIVGKSPIIEFSDFINKIKEVNDKLIEKHKCQEHENEGVKYCKDCELWLCEECIKIHSIFNKAHSLIEKEIPLRNKCKTHTKEFNQYFCLNCKEDICPFCLTMNGNHRDHKSIKFDKFFNLKEEIKSKLKLKTYNDFIKNMENIKEKYIIEKNNKIEKFKETINILINKIKISEENYIKDINNKIDYLNKNVDIIKECYKYFYFILSSEKRDFNELNFLRQITEITDIRTDYNNYSDLSKAIKIIENFNSNIFFLYNFKNDDTPHQFSFNFEKIFRNKILNNSINFKSLSVQSKYNVNLLKYKEIKYEKTIKANNGTIYAISKINDKECAVACGKDILIINYSNNNNEQLNEKNTFYSLKGHSKNVLCLTLLENNENNLISGSEDKTVKIWDIKEKKCVDTLKKDFQRIDSLLSFQNNILIVGSHIEIKIINIENKEELFKLVGHEKSICSIIKIRENIIASCSYDNAIKIWDINNKVCQFTLYGHNSSVFCILLLKDGRLISGSGSGNKSLKIWNLEKKICEFYLAGHKREVRDIKQLSNGWIISASMDKTIKVWNIHKKICIQTLVSHYDVIFCLCIIDKNKFMSGGRDQDIIIWKY